MRNFLSLRCSDSDSMCDSCFCILLARKSQHASSHIDRVDTSRCQPSATHPLFDKPAFSRFSQLFQPRIVVHLFGKIVKSQVCQKMGMSCRRLVVTLGHKITRRMSHTPTDSRTVGRCTICAFVTLGQKTHKMHISHTPTDSRTVGPCTICSFVALGQKNHKMHISHTPTDSRTVG